MHIKSFHLYNLTLTCVTGGIGVVIVTLPGTGVVKLPGTGIVKLPGLSVTFCAFANVVIVIQTTKHTAKNLLDGAIGLFIEIRFTVFDFAVLQLHPNRQYQAYRNDLLLLGKFQRLFIYACNFAVASLYVTTINPIYTDL